MKLETLENEIRELSKEVLDQYLENQEKHKLKVKKIHKPKKKKVSYCTGRDSMLTMMKCSNMINEKSNNNIETFQKCLRVAQNKTDIQRTKRTG